MDFLNDGIKVFVILWALIDPVGTIPVFLAVSKQHPPTDFSRLAFRAVCIAWLVLIFFMTTGEFILNAMEIPLSAFQVSGGIILFLFALTMIFGESKPEEEVNMAKSFKDTSVFPLAMPSIASPGAIMGIVLLTEKRSASFEAQLMVAALMTVILLITFVLLYSSKYIDRLIGDSGASLLSRVMGLIICAIAVKYVLDGIKLYFQL
ncbi:MarC family protein [Pseudobacteriovorax antillogorgiicola]|uniref:UPF0056 membrane protein n=1 Tax=Pseudobacteriovorax antillogorgiicola TaxID=1513793 RepID=A0A1Y6BSG2_9BACT|nr:MarC family protein [Pseudobacteriovorax antillogorgiicola]TCS53009.1 multiple antibiotic resistance protein [Pseudobacteriovorax antillogorgiicola]SMF26988.1 multiple antibiotic resistance protein [Pseudobacteriovorax antillogorgiicola]